MFFKGAWGKVQSVASAQTLNPHVYIQIYIYIYTPLSIYIYVYIHLP